MKPAQLIAAVAAVLLALGVPSAAIAAPQGVDDFDFESFDAQYTLDLDGEGRATLHVVETIVALFPENQNRGIIRAIPLKDGDVPLDVQMTSVTDETGADWYYERDDYDGFAEFALGTDAYLNGRTTFVLDYTLRDPVRHFSDDGSAGPGGDEFYWDVNGNGWAQSFGRVSAHVELGPALAAALTGESACYVGYYGDDGRCELARTGDAFDVGLGPVGPYSTVTIAIGFDGGTVVQPPLPRDSWIVQVAPKVLLGVMVLLLVLSIVLKNAVWRDARGRSTVIAEYTPPSVGAPSDDSDLLLYANVVGRASAGLAAMFVDLAVRGILRIVDHLPGEPDVPANRRFGLELLTAEGASARERTALVALFGPALHVGKEVRPGSLDAGKGAALYALSARAAAAALVDGYRATPVSPWPRALTRASFVTVLLLIAAGVWAALNDVLDGAVVWPAVGAVVLAIAIPTVLIAPARLTRKGAELRDYLRGIRLYLTVAEEERIRMLQSPDGALRVDVTDARAVVKLNERLLGYAVLWGVEDEWVEVLARTGTPDWLDGDTLDSSMFSSFTSTSTASVRPIVTSSSGGGGSSWSSSGSSSSSSGSGGGGFSGGGGGGGGGGGR